MFDYSLCPGTKWWKFDIHAHTPASKDYRSEVSPEEWLLNYMRHEFDCVIVTDHNTGVWIDKLNYTLTDLKSSNHCEYWPITIFPGVELSVNGNIHILAVFDCDKTTSDIDRLLGAVGYNGEKGDTTTCTTLSAIEVINKITKAGAIAIPAHVDQPSGLFHECEGITLSQLLNCIDLFAMEIRNNNL
jgi:histidinol phosphatase-like PHP family hydrolase